MDDVYLFLDLETEGLNVEIDRILEVGWVITDDSLEYRYGSGSLLVGISNPHLSPLTRDMHQSSGLLDALADPHDQRRRTLRQIENEIVSQLDVAAGGRIRLAGSGVDFDRRYIRSYMPSLDALLHYQLMDTSQIRRFLRDVCAIPEEEMTYMPQDGLTRHRAADDVEMAIGELKFYRGLLDSYRSDWMDLNS
jgi:oligoribonuclease (3'-5' exoribonuclease)